MKITLDIDEAALRRAAGGLSASPTLLEDLATDPQKVLSKIGITVDDETARRISARASARDRRIRTGAGTAALILHIDT